MKCVLTADDLWNIGFDYYFDGSVELPAEPEEDIQHVYNGYNTAKEYREAINRKENSNI